MSDPPLAFVLASTSPRRRQLMAFTGWRFEVLAVDVNESVQEGEPPSEYVLRLAASKAYACVEQMQFCKRQETFIIIAADTTVVDGSDILGKPLNEIDAARMLTRLCGKLHQVYTGIAVWRISHQKIEQQYQAVCITDVPMRAYKKEEMMAYIASGDPLDKAGAYAIQHPTFRPVENLNGCYANVMGLPICAMVQTVNRLGLRSQTNISQACQEQLGFNCPLTSSMMF